jgi:hypothetical protein
MALAQQRCPSPPGSIEAGSFPANPNFAAKAGPFTNVSGSGADDCFICAAEKANIQVRYRKQPTSPLVPNRPTYLEHEYFCLGAGRIWQLGMSIEQESSVAVKWNCS